MIPAYRDLNDNSPLNTLLQRISSARPLLQNIHTTMTKPQWVALFVTILATITVIGLYLGENPQITSLEHRYVTIGMYDISYFHLFIAMSTTSLLLQFLFALGRASQVPRINCLSNELIYIEQHLLMHERTEELQEEGGNRVPFDAPQSPIPHSGFQSMSSLPSFIFTPQTSPMRINSEDPLPQPQSTATQKKLQSIVATLENPLHLPLLIPSELSQILDEPEGADDTTAEPSQE